jgi:hypothetical protein
LREFLGLEFRREFQGIDAFLCRLDADRLGDVPPHFHVDELVVLLREEQSNSGSASRASQGLGIAESAKPP